MVRKFALFALSIFVSLLIPSLIRAEICVTTGEGYASLSKEPLDEITDLMVSPRPEDEQRLSQVLKKYLADEYIFPLKAGIEVETGPLWDRGRPVWIKPVGSKKEYYVLRIGIKNCRPE
jgi:hypothetical protein